MTILQFDERKNSDTGEISYYARALADFVEFGKIKPATFDLKLPNSDYVDKLKQHLGKKVDLDVLIPKPNYPLELLS